MAQRACGRRCLEDFLKQLGLDDGQMQELVELAAADQLGRATATQSTLDDIDASSALCIGAMLLGMDAVELHRHFGRFSFTYVLTEEPRLPKSMARNFVDFVASLNDLFWHLGSTLPDLQLPWLELRDVGPASLVAALWSCGPCEAAWLDGFVQTAGTDLFQTNVTITVTAPPSSSSPQLDIDYRRNSFAGSNCNGGGASINDSDSTLFHIRYPATSVLGLRSAAALVGNHSQLSERADIDQTVLYEALPFHLILDMELCVLHVGTALARLVPELERAGARADAVLELDFPIPEWSSEALLRVARVRGRVVLRHAASGTSFSGSLSFSRVHHASGARASSDGGARGSDGVGDEVFVFVGSPCIFSLDEMRAWESREGEPPGRPPAG
ncbi:hypothetical protein FOA52_004472 [Chlamydomonas sp. UWO 241]|nr:hypothetical protein FOA52_004472 [Chlamydomonas sp. UWO 241]